MKNFSVDWASQVLLAGENLPAGAGDIRDAGSIPGSGRSLGDGNGSPLQCSCLEDPVDRGAWQAAVRGLHRVGHDYRAEQHLEFTMHVLRSYWVVLSTQEIGSDLYLKSYFL